ncbi:hypothetical protein [Alkalihalobacterium sp. APHAB7]|uniref:hypothetical protein n=1 Tax=Alkalihalobacterium sp. APHAB7 TaxID=3402081 RepID=UPI003AB0C1D6
MSDMNKKLDEILRHLVEFKASTNNRFDQMEASTNQRFEQVDKRFDQVDKRLDRIDTTLGRIEKDQAEDVIALLKQMNHKMDVRDSEIQALNKRVFKVESEIERLSHQ